MSESRRNVLKMGAALAAVPLAGKIGMAAGGIKTFSSGVAELDRVLGGGLRAGSVLAVAGVRGSGKSAFFLRMAKANGILDVYPMGTGTSDMLSIMGREDGKYIGSLMLDAPEPATEKERAEMALDAGARNAFLTRWFARTREVMRESGGLFAISVCEAAAGAAAEWAGVPDYVIAVDGLTGRVIRSV